MARIRVLHNYGGKLTHEQRIEPNDYDADDPRIFGLAKYLVDNGHAKLVSGTLDEVPHPAPAPQPTTDPVEPEKPGPTPEQLAAEQREIENGRNKDTAPEEAPSKPKTK
jgi:hypothetical protein